MKPVEVSVPRLWGNVGAITLWPFIFYRKDQRGRPELRAHEEHHWQTALKYGVLPWYIAYLILLPLYGGGSRHPLERAAYAEEDRVRRGVREKTMDRVMYYRDADHGDVVAIVDWPAVDQKRREFDSVAEMKAEMNRSYGGYVVKYERIPPPPDVSSTWYFDGNRYWRKEPARKPSLWREGIHALVPFPNVVLAFLAFWLMPAAWPLVAFAALFSFIGAWVFIRYEETEEKVIRDRAYRDLGGYKTGLAVSSALCLLATLVLYQAGVYCGFATDAPWC